jgi:hypothetical protein
LLTSGWVPDSHIMQNIKKTNFIVHCWAYYRTSLIGAVLHAV